MEHFSTMHGNARQLYHSYNISLAYPHPFRYSSAGDFLCSLPNGVSRPSGSIDASD